MRKLITLAFYSLLLTAAGCSRPVSLSVTDEVINPCYLGNGVEWDPYDEALSWGSGVSEEDWNKLFERLDYMKPQYVRCMINSPFTYFDGEGFDDNRNVAYLKKLLGYCQENDILVVYGEYNPPTWEMKDSPAWVKASVRHLNYLVGENGFTCIKYFVIFNEPDGDWASPNGDFAFWKGMVGDFQAEMSLYPALADVRIAGPDAVIGYRNGASAYDAEGWLRETVETVPQVGIYDMHAYPGQRLVRSGEFEKTLRGLKAIVGDAPIILGEAGYKYFSDPADAALAKEYWKRVEGHPFTKGGDCNMLVYDDFYALDMPLLLMSVMNAGFSGAAAWMLDDAMHSSGDSGKTEDIKLWGMWNILGAEVFGDPSQEDVRPWYYTWSLMCRHFPRGSRILKLSGALPSGVAAVAAQLPDGSYSVALVNFGSRDHTVALTLPVEAEGYTLQTFRTAVLESQAVSGSCFELPSQSFAIFAKE